MKANEQTIQQIERFLKKIASKYPMSQEAEILTDIHVRVSQESGDIMAFNDDDDEITRCVVEEWIDNKDDNFYGNITNILRLELTKNKEQISKYLASGKKGFVITVYNTVGAGQNLQFDIIFQDCAKYIYTVIYEDVAALVRKGGIIVADDTMFPVCANVRENLGRHMDRYNRQMFSDRRFFSTMLPIGHGMTLSWKNF